MRAPRSWWREVVDRRADGAADDVVGQHDHHPVAVDEALGQRQGLGDAAGPLLVGVGEAVDAPLVAAAEEAEELAGVGAAGDHHDLVDPGRDQGLDGVGDHRPVVDRQEVLVGDAGEGVEPGPGPPCEDDAFHGRRDVSRRRAVTGAGGPVPSGQAGPADERP